MKYTKKIIAVAFLLSVFAIITFSLKEKFVMASNEVNLVITTSKNSFQIGEIVPTVVTLTNQTLKVIELKGYTIKIASEKDENFKVYVPKTPDFTVDGADTLIQINPNSSFSQTKTVLWNQKPPDVSSLSLENQKQYLDGKILTEYAFPQPGIYFLKINATIIRNEKKETVESEPIQITVEAPEGEDLEVWNKIKDNGDFAYFIQEGDVPRQMIYKAGDKAKFLKDIEQILTDHPNSFYAQSLRESLNKFRANEAKRQKFLQKLQNQKEKQQ